MKQSQSVQVLACAILWVSLIGLSWAFMQICHELGHLLAAWVTGGTIVLLDLHPLHLSHTLVHPNPKPILVIWAGPVAGVLLPIIFWFGARRFCKGTVRYFRFFCGFCLIANGAYLGCAAIEAVGDARDLLRNDVPILALLAFGGLAVPSGFLLWNGLGPSFGIGGNKRPNSIFEASLTSSLLLLIWSIESFCFPIHFAN